jgi:signal transduction histidine kinase
MSLTKVASIRRKVLVVVTTAMSVLLVVTALLLDYFVDRELQERFDGELFAVARSLQTLTLHEVQGVELHFSDKVMQNFSALDKPDYFELVDGNGKLIERSISLRKSNARLHATDPLAAIQWVQLIDGTRGRMVSLHFRPDLGDTLNTSQRATVKRTNVTLRVARAQALLDRAVINLDVAFIIAVLAVLLISAALVWWSVGRELDVIDRIAARTELDPHLRMGSEISLDGIPKELTRFVESVNRATHALSATLERERRWSRDLAHELRTPIAELRTLLDVAMSFPEAYDAQKVQTQARAIAVDMDSLVSSLLLMSRVESGIEDISLQAVDLRALLLPLIRIQASWQLDIPEPFWIRTDPRLLKIVLSNLVNNAIAYADPPNSVRIIAIVSTGIVALEISNRAPALSSEDLDLMLRRFWRKQGIANVSGRSGLGLSIAYALCEMLKLRVTLHLSDDQVLTVRIDQLQLESMLESP